MSQYQHLFYRLFAAAILFIGSFTSVAVADLEMERELASFVGSTVSKFNRRAKLGVIVANASTGDVVYSHGSDRPLVPASVLKIITSVAALKLLGAQYRFPSELFVDVLPHHSSATGKSSGDVGNLYFRGYGDPSLTDEKLYLIARTIRRHGVKRINNIVIDDTLFMDPPGPSGNRPYQAALSATSINHNSYAVDVAPGRVGERAKVFLTEGLVGLDFKLANQVTSVKGSGNKFVLTQTPISRYFKQAQHNSETEAFFEFSVPKTTVKLRGTIGVGSELVTYYSTVPHPPAYLGALLKHHLEKEGINVIGSVVGGETAADAKLLRVFNSSDLTSILRDLNHYSNNFIAGQILFSLGQDSLGYFHKELAIERVGDFLNHIGIGDENYQIYDGSGLDKRNRLTVQALVTVLVAAYRDFSVAPDLVASLSRFGHSGTLKKRKLERRRPAGSDVDYIAIERSMRLNGVWAKTGTLAAVSSLAGYVPGEDGELYAAVIMMNGRSKSFAMRFENEIVKIIAGADRK